MGSRIGVALLLVAAVAGCGDGEGLPTTTTAWSGLTTSTAATTTTTAAPTTTATASTTTTTGPPVVPPMYLRDLWIEPTPDLAGLAVWVWVTDADGRGVEGAQVEVALEPQWGVTLRIITGPDGLGTGVAPDLLATTQLAAVSAEPVAVSHPGFAWVTPEGGPSLMSVWQPLGNLWDPPSAQFGARKGPWCPRPEAVTVRTKAGYGAPVVLREAGTLGPVEAWQGYLDTAGVRWLVTPGHAFLVEMAAMLPCEGSGSLTAAESYTALEAYLGAEWPTTWECLTAVPGIGELGPGSVVRCEEIRPPGDDSQTTILTVLVLDAARTMAVTVAGVWEIRLNPGHLARELGSGKACSDLAFDRYRFAYLSADLRLQYFGVVLYWFMEGRPARLDPDGNGRPCEALVPAGVIEAIWAGGWFQASD